MDSAQHVSLSPAPVAPSEQETSSQYPFEVPSSSGTYPPIRAPPSSDFDVEKASIKKEDKARSGGGGGGGSSSSSSSSGSVSSSDIEEGFMSGEEEFETASERPFIADPDEETLELAMEENRIVESSVGSVVGSSEFGSMMPKAQVSDDDSLVEPPRVAVLGDEEEEEDSELTVEPGLVADESLPDKSSLVKSAVDGVLYSEGKEPLLEENLKLDLGSARLVEEDRVAGVVETSNEASVVNQGETLPENSKLNEVLVPRVGSQDKEDVSIFNDNDVLEEKSEVLAGDHIAELNSGGRDDSVIDGKQLVEVEENGTHGTRDIKEVGLPAEETAVLSGGSREASTEVREPVDTNFVGVNKDDNLKIEENSADEMKEQIALGVDAGGVQELEEIQVSESKTLGFNAVEGTGSLDAGSDEAPEIINRTADSKSVEADIEISQENENSDTKYFSSENSLTPATCSIMQEPQTESETAKKDYDEIDGNGVGDNVSMPHGSEKPELESEQQTDRGIKLSEPDLTLAADEVESGPSKMTDGTNKAEIENTTSNMENLNSVQNDKQEDEGQHKMQFTAAKMSDHSLGAGGDGIEIRNEADNNGNPGPEYKEEDEGFISDEENEGLLFEGSETAKQIMKELAQGSGVSSHSDAESYRDHSQRIDGQIIMESDEEVDTDEEEEGKELFDSAALTALLKAATSGGSEGGPVTITSSDGSRLFSVERPAGLGSSIRSLRPAPRPNRANIFTPGDFIDGRESDDKLTEEEKKKLEKIQLIRVKFLRLISRVGHSAEDSIAAQVLYRLVLASGRHTSQACSLEAAKTTALQLEEGSADEKNNLDFSLNIIVLGKTGVGKSATINSIFGQEKSTVNAFEPATTAVKEILGTVDGVKIRVFDTPGLRSSVMEQAFNQRVLSSVKKLTKKYPPDILLYVDRLDTQTRDLNDLPLLRSISSTLGSSIWRSAIVTLTHAASAPPDGPSGSPLSYEVFVAQRSHIVQQAIGQAVGDLRMMNPSLMNPVSLVENHPSCRRNREGQRILPNGQAWRSQLLLLCYSLKILSEVSSLSKPQDSFDHRKLFGFRVRSPPLPYLLSSLLQSRAHPKLPADQGGDNVDSDIDLDDLSDSDQEEEEDEYDQLPPFKPLRRSQIAKLSKDQRKAYFDEYDYRVKLLQKKQWKEELRRMREMKKKGKSVADNLGFMSEDADQENGGPAAVPVPLPDMVLPPSFDGDNPAYRYRFLEPTSQLLARPVLDTHGWDHDCGYDGVSLEENLAIAGRFPAGVTVQITKDKKEFNIHLDSSVAAKHGENGSTLAGFDIQTIGKQLAYIVKGETRFKNLKKNKTAGGICITFLGENVVTGLKIEDQIAIGKRLMLVGSTGSVRSQGDVAYGANLEARLMEKDYPIGQDQTTLGLSLMKWRGDLALGANLQSQFSIGRSSKMSVRVGLNNKLSGQITVRTSSSEQLQLALVGFLPIAMAIYRSIFPAAGESYPTY